MVRSRWYILPTFLLPGLLMIVGFLCGIELYGTRDNPMLPRGVLAVGGVMLGLAAGIVVLVPIYRLAMRPTIWAVAPHLCASCGYNLTSNTSGICPECGQPVGKAFPQEAL